MCVRWWSVYRLFKSQLIPKINNSSIIIYWCIPHKSYLLINYKENLRDDVHFSYTSSLVYGFHSLTANLCGQSVNHWPSSSSYNISSSSQLYFFHFFSWLSVNRARLQDLIGSVRMCWRDWIKQQSSKRTRVSSAKRGELISTFLVCIPTNLKTLKWPV